MRFTPSLSDLLFGCWHRNLRFPVRVKRGQPRSRAAWRTGTYVACLDCGKEFSYDWQEMRIVGRDSHGDHARHSLRGRAA